MTDFCLKFLGFNNYQWSADSLSWWGVAPDRYERSNQKELFRQRWFCCVQGYTGAVSFAVTNFRCKLSLLLQLASNVGVNGKKRVVFAIEADAAILAQRGQDKKNCNREKVRL